MCVCVSGVCGRGEGVCVCKWGVWEGRGCVCVVEAVSPPSPSLSPEGRSDKRL